MVWQIPLDRVAIPPRVSNLPPDEEVLRAARTQLTAYMIGVVVRIKTGKSTHPDDVHTKLTTLINAGSMTRVSIGNRVVYQARQIGEK